LRLHQVVITAKPYASTPSKSTTEADLVTGHGVALPHLGLRGFRSWRQLFGAGVMPKAGSDRWWLYPASRRSGACVHDTLGHAKTQGSPCALHRRPLRPSRFARIRRRRSAIAWRDTPNSRATAAWPASSTSSAHSRRVACSSASSREMRPSSECRCRFSVVVRSLRGRGTHSGYPPRRSTKGFLDGTLHLLGPTDYLEQRLAAARWRV
jgi:hypothetical protein